MKRRPVYPSCTIWSLTFILLMFLSACGPLAAATTGVPVPSATPSAVPTARPTFAPATVAASPIAPTPAPPMSAPAAAVVPTVTAASTSRPVLTLAVPAQWAEVAQTAVNAANAAQAVTGLTWQLKLDGTADVILEQSTGGLTVAKEQLVLAVPFTTEWEDVTLADAQAIRDQGHELVTVLPWRALDGRQKALRIDGLGPDDPGYPFQETWSLATTSAKQQAARAFLPYLQAAWPPAPVHLLAVGDIMLDRSLGSALERGDIAYPFAAVADQLRAADITVGNIESALGDKGEPEAKRYPFRAPPAAAAALRLAGFDVVSLANNHAMDYGSEALLQAIGFLQDADVATTGAGADATAAHQPAIVERNGLKLAFLSYVDVPVEASTGFDTASWTATEDSPGLAWADPELIKADIERIRDQVDIVIVLLHSGLEYQEAPSEVQVAAAYAAIDSGADLVVGHHAHILQGIEWYGNGVILYGTGNFAFEIDGDPTTALFHIWLDRDGVREISLEPALIQFGGQPRLAEPWVAPAIRRQVYALTDLLNSR